MLDFGQDCESGIPIEYLSGLDSAYELLLHSLDEAGCKVIRKNWNDFGEEENAGSEILEYLSKTRSSRTIDVCINDLRKKYVGVVLDFFPFSVYGNKTDF